MSEQRGIPFYRQWLIMFSDFTLTVGGAGNRGAVARDSSK